MKRTNIFFYTVIALCLSFSCILAFRNSQKDKIIKEQDIELAKWSQELRTFKDKYGKEHAQAKQVTVPISAMKGKVDKIKEVLNVKAKQIKEVTEVNSKITGQLQAKAELVQVVKAENRALKDSLYRIRYQDKFLKFDGELNTATNDFKASYTYEDSLSIVQYEDNSYWRKKRYVDVVSNNPNRKITALKSVQVGDDKIRRFSIGPQMGYYYDPVEQRWLPAIGVGLSFNVIRF